MGLQTSHYILTTDRSRKLQCLTQFSPSNWIYFLVIDPNSSTSGFCLCLPVLMREYSRESLGVKVDVRFDISTWCLNCLTPALSLSACPLSFYIYFMFLKHLNLHLLLRLLYLKHLLRYQYCKLASLYFKQITTISEYYLGNSTKYF